MAILQNSESVMRKLVLRNSNMRSIASEPKRKRYTSMLTFPMPAAMTGMEKRGIRPNEMPDTMPLINPSASFVGLYLLACACVLLCMFTFI